MNKFPFSKLQLFVLLSFALTAAPLYADPGAEVDRYIESEIELRKIPGIAIAVVRDGEVIKAQGYGLANVEHRVPVKPETVFQSGSVGKPFTATAILMLVDEGKLGLDDPIRQYFPEGPERWDEIKVHHLLSHTAGIKNYTAGDGSFDYRRDYTEDELVREAMKLPPDFEPGEKWNYSNTGYVLLGILIHRVSGKFYGEFLQERIFGPLDMKTTRVISEEDIVPNRAAGYRLVKGELKNQEWVAPSLNTTADGSLYLTVLDLAKWAVALNSGKLIKPSVLEQMWTVAPLRDGKPNQGNYGYGWMIREIGGRRVVEHGGSWQGFRSHFQHYRDDSLTVVVLVNRSNTATNVIAYNIAKHYLPGLAGAEAAGASE